MNALQPWQVWWAELDPTRGHEQAGLRPVVIVSSSLHLRVAGQLVAVLPLTTRAKRLRYRISVQAAGTTSYVITDQVRTIATARLRRPLSVLAPQEIAEVRRVLAKMIDLA